MTNFQFPILNIKIVSRKNRKHLVDMGKEFQTFGYTPQSFRENLWHQIQNSRNQQTREFKSLLSMAMNHEQIALLIKHEDQRPYAEIVIRAVSFIHRIEALSPLGGIDSHDKMQPEAFYELLKQLGFKLNLVK
ncbi:MAG TPA: hypothetical protein V6D21_00245 [Candidatus Obscuribacterales bacterium]